MIMMFPTTPTPANPKRNILYDINKITVIGHGDVPSNSKSRGSHINTNNGKYTIPQSEPKSNPSKKNNFVSSTKNGLKGSKSKDDAIYDSAEIEDLFDDYEDSGNDEPVLVSVELLPTNQQKTRILDLSVITSAYGHSRLQRYLNENSILYIDPNKKRTNNWLSLNRLQLPLGENQYGSIRRITYTDGKVKIQNSIHMTQMQEKMFKAGLIDEFGNSRSSKDDIIYDGAEIEDLFDDYEDSGDYQYEGAYEVAAKNKNQVG